MTLVLKDLKEIQDQREQLVQLGRKETLALLGQRDLLAQQEHLGQLVPQGRRGQPVHKVLLALTGGV